MGYHWENFVKAFGPPNFGSNPPPSSIFSEQTQLSIERTNLLSEKFQAAIDTYRLNTDRSAAVSTEAFYNEDMSSCPRGVKVILLTAGGVAVLGHYTGDPFYVGWYALPRKKTK